MHLCIYPCWYNSTATVKTVMVPSLETAHRKDSMTRDIKMKETRGPLGRLATKILILSFRKEGTKVLPACTCVVLCVMHRRPYRYDECVILYNSGHLSDRETDRGRVNDITVRSLEESIHISTHHFCWALNMACVRVHMCALAEAHLSRCRRLKPWWASEGPSIL